MVIPLIPKVGYSFSCLNFRLLSEKSDITMRFRLGMVNYTVDHVSHRNGKIGLKTADRFKGLIVLKVSSRLYFSTCVSYQVIVQNFEAKLCDTNVMFGETVLYLSHL